MNTYHAIIAEPGAGSAATGSPARAHPGTLSGRPEVRAGGIRGAGQYCCRPGLTGTDPYETAPRLMRGIVAVHGMRP
ncbi:MAG: hypothetical protein LUQ71_01640 [Methanoregula sp.]|nr:hypothetical protein [Methanoregula sp.]